jgi:hypothetical protein
VEFQDLPYGYYLITSTLGATVTINSNTPNVTVIDKNQEPVPDFDKQVQTGVDEHGNPIWADANSANIGDQYAMFEAIHGSAPRMIEMGRGDYANPSSIIKAGAMLLRHIGKTEEAQKLETALDTCPVVITGKTDGPTAVQYTDALIAML